MSDLEPTDPEDRKIITLATSAQARTGATAGACLRDTDGRTYAGTNVDLSSLQLSAIAVVIAMAVSSGAAGVEAVAISGESPVAVDRAMITEFAGVGVPIWLVDQRGAVLELITSDQE